MYVCSVHLYFLFIKGDLCGSSTSSCLNWERKRESRRGCVILQYYARNHLHIHLLTNQPLFAERVSCPPGDGINGSLSPADSSLL